MKTLHNLFEKNKAWTQKMVAEDKDFFNKLAQQQTPEYLWIGCSDSRVPSTQIVDLLPGEMFVHRNIANMVVQTDLNCLSVLQYAVDVLKVKHIIVCGHYGCGGVKAAHDEAKNGLIDNWLQNVRAVKLKHADLLNQCPNEKISFDLLCALNAIEQSFNVAESTILKAAWERGQEIVVHSWIYGLQNGHLNDLGMNISNSEEIAACKKEAVNALVQKYNLKG